MGPTAPSFQYGYGPYHVPPPFLYHLVQVSQVGALTCDTTGWHESLTRCTNATVSSRCLDPPTGVNGGNVEGKWVDLQGTPELSMDRWHFAMVTSRTAASWAQCARPGGIGSVLALAAGAEM